MELSYYTIEQAARKLECLPDELEHLILTEKLDAHLYSNLKKFIVVEEIDKKFIGRGIATYEGLIKTRNIYIRQLLQKKKITIDAWVIITQPQNIRYWAKDHPYKSDDFFLTAKISAWIPHDLSEAQGQKYLLAIPMLREGPGMMNLFNKTLEAIVKSRGIDPNEGSKLKPAPEYSYSFQDHSQFEQDGLRITHSDLTKYKESREAAHGGTPRVKAKITLPWCDNKEKHSRIDPVIERLYGSDTTASAKTLWNKLENDHELDDPQFDGDHVIQAIEGLVLDWQNQNKRVSELTFKTFSNKISEIRKFYKSIN